MGLNQVEKHFSTIVCKTPLLLKLLGCFIYILDSSNSSSIMFELVNLVLALEATEPVSEPVTQMAVKLINNHLILVQQKR